MKAFVIKNKEGKYWCGYDLLVNKNLFTIKISNAVLNNPTKKNCLDAIKEYGLKDCEVVEITIAEEKHYDTISTYAYGKKYVDKLKEKNKKLIEENKQLKRARKELRRKFEQEERSNIENISDGEEIIKQLNEQLAEKDKIIKELKTRISELEDKDWYEKCIKQLEEQNNNLIKERDELAFEKRNTFGLIEKVSDNGQLEIRKHLCEEIYNFIMDNWEDVMGRQGRWQNFSGTCIDLKEDLEKIAKNGYKIGAEIEFGGMTFTHGKRNSKGK